MLAAGWLAWAHFGRGSAATSPEAGGTEAGGPPATGDSPVERTIWNACYMHGSKVGYERVTYRRVERDGQRLVEIEGFVHLTIKRFQDTTVTTLRFTTTETPDGKLLEVEGQMVGGGLPVVTRGRVRGEQLEIETTTQGKTVRSVARWLPEYRGCFAVDQSLERQPMQPGEKRLLYTLLPGTDQVAKVELSARQRESVKLLSDSAELLRIDTVITLAKGQSLEGPIWTDRAGAILRRHEPMDLDAYQVPEALALEKPPAGGFDVGVDLSVPVDRRLSAPHDTKRIRYRLTLDDGDPSGTFVSGASQLVRPIDPHTAEVTVFALRPQGDAGNAEAAADPPTADDLAPNNWIQSDNAKIIAVARETAGGQQDPWKLAQSLESRVRALIPKKDYSQAFASAAEVLETGQGDCTEHAVLLAALARALGIPARVAIGLVYLEQADKPMFGYHMWDELYLGGRWVPMDATLARGGIGAAHLKIAHSSLKGASALSSFLPVANVAGRLKIKIEDVRPEPQP
jgi:hypothetical protein